MSSAGIFVVGSAVSLICLVGLILSIVEMKRLGRGGGERSVSMAVVAEHRSLRR